MLSAALASGSVNTEPAVANTATAAGREDRSATVVSNRLPRSGKLRQALLCCPPDSDAAVLEAQLRRLGMHVTQQWPLPDGSGSEGDTLLLLAVTLENAAQVSRLAARHTGLVLGLIDTGEARLLERLGTLGLHGVLLRPYRFAALQAQLSVAMASHSYQARLHDKVQHLEAQLRARRVIEHATRILMVIHEIAPHEAYERLRSLAMSQRQPLAEAAQMLVRQSAAITDNKNACPSEVDGQADPAA